MSPRPTMRDVARLAGVSANTVSRCVNNSDYVSATTRARVNAAIAELGFQRNEVARTLRGSAAATVALVIEDIDNPFSAAITRGVGDIAQERGHLLIVGTTGFSFERESSLVAELVRRRVDGLLIVPAAHDHAGLQAEMGRWVPMVFIDRVPAGISADAVVLDNRGGVGQAVDHLVAAGHHRIAYIGGDPEVFTIGNRLHGFREALTRHGLPYDDGLVWLGACTADAARATVTVMLHGSDPPTAVFADTHPLTIGALQAVSAGHCRVDVAGFDGIELTDLHTTPVALITYRPDELGRAAARVLFDRIDGDTAPPRTIVLDTDLVLRGDASLAS